MAWLMRGVIVTLCLPVHGCDTVDGGAVELSWKLRPASSEVQDKFVDCQPGSAAAGWGPVDKIRLHWDAEGSDGSTEMSRAWSCGDNHGATAFQLPVGPVRLWVTPECLNERPAEENTFIAPALLQREVMRGQIINLGAVEVVVAVSNCRTATNPGGQPCICAESN